MSEPTVDPNTIIKLHQANYAVFQARTEKEIDKAIYQSLTACKYLSLYYSVNENGLRGIFAYDPHNKQNLEGAIEQVELIPAEIVRYFSNGTQIGSLDSAILPSPFRRILAENNCNQCAVIPVMNDVTILAVLILGAHSKQQIEEENIDPLIHLCETIPMVLENVKAARATQKRLRELETISETSSTISSSNDLNELYEIIHKQIRAMLGDVHFSIALYEQQNNTIELPYIYSDGKTRSLPPYELGQGLISILIRTHQPMLLWMSTISNSVCAR
jgi:transcriptional regulator with GAF, ATPase, and Fis domain